jgi:hypothetical protein
MFCPLCGATDQSANAYCKRCGEWLPEIRSRAGGAFGGKTPQQNIFTGLFMSAISTLAALFSAVALYATYLGSDDAKWSIYVAAAFCVCIAGWQSSSFIIGLKLRRRFKKGRSDSEPDLELTERQRVLALNESHMSSVAGVPSVTEGTTRVLEPSRPSRRDTQR